MKALFTNVPLEKTINVILDRVYNKKVISMGLKKSTLKKLIKDTCSKTAFLGNNKIYEQIDGVSMGSSLAPVLANIIMTELELCVVDDLISSDRISFYGRYVDDTLLLVKPNDIENVLNSFNSFHPNIQFTVDKFENCTPHFLDLEIHPDGISIYRKDTHTGQYTHYSSYCKWNYKIAWIRALIYRAIKLCDANKLSEEFRSIKLFAAYNGYPKWVTNGIFRKCQQNTPRPEREDDALNIYLTLPYCGRNGENIIKRCRQKLYKCFKPEKKVRINTIFTTMKISYFTSMKDRIPFLNQSSVVYNFECPGCSKCYVGKTDCTLFKRSEQHGWKQKDSSVYKHLDECHEYQYIKTLYGLNTNDTNEREFKINTVKDNMAIIGRNNNWLTLAYLEAIMIKENNPELNRGLKAAKELQLF